MIIPMKRRLTARAVIVNEKGELFCVRQNDYKGSVVLPHEYWCVPGGGIEVNESLLLGLEREIIEEVGIKPIIGELLYIQQFAHKDTEELELFFHVTNHQDFLTIDLSKTSHGVEELAEFGFINTDKFNVLPKFLCQQDLKAIKPSGNITKIFSYL